MCKFSKISYNKQQQKPEFSYIYEICCHSFLLPLDNHDFMLFLRFLAESFNFALHALSVNKLRTFLSLLGISIGIFAIISVLTVVDSLEKNVRGSVASLGDNVLYIQKWPWATSSDYPWWKYLNRPSPSLQEAEDIKRRLLSVEAVSFQAWILSKTIKAGKNSVENVGVMPVSHDYEQIKLFDLVEGRYFTESESAGGSPVAIIGYDVYDKLFPNGNAIGKDILALGRKMSVIGVFAKEGSSLVGNSMDELVLTPVKYARNIVDITVDQSQPWIQVKGKAGINNAELKDEVRGIMRSLRQLSPREEDNFALNESSLLSAGITSIFGVINIAGWIIGGFSILVGGFGIANIMFVSVKERTSIIGIQKSLGAKRYFILMQFLVESIILCLVGGIIGLMIVFGLTYLASASMDFKIALSSGNIITGLVISVSIGVISGFIPAYTASRLDPVEAIRAS